MRIIIYWIASAIIVFGCTSEANNVEKIPIEEYPIVHYNIVIAPDLSNRMDFLIRRKPIKDLQIARIVLDNLYPKILNSNGRSENQKNIVKLDFINKGLINEYNIQTQKLELDFNKFDK